MNSLSHQMISCSGRNLPSVRVTDFAQRFANLGGIVRPDQTRNLPAIFNEDQRRPQRDPEGTPKRPTFAIFDLDVADRLVWREG